VAHALEGRAASFDGLMNRFAALGESARGVNELTTGLSARKNEGAPESELLDGLRVLDEHMLKVVVDAEALAQDAAADGWPEISRQADSVRQQVRAAKNKLALAHRTVAARAPS
jgi:hypothetical protein